MSAAERETPAGEAMREAVAREIANLRNENAIIRNERDEARAKLAKATETYTDDYGYVWSPPTAWAYFAACGALSAAQAKEEAAEAALTTLRADHAAEVARLKGAVALALEELNWQVEQAEHCGDPNYECPMQDIHAPGDGHLLARNALRAALAPKETTDA